MLTEKYFVMETYHYLRSRLSFISIIVQDENVPRRVQRGTALSQLKTTIYTLYVKPYFHQIKHQSVIDSLLWDKQEEYL